MCLAGLAWDKTVEAKFDDLVNRLEEADQNSGNELTKQYLRGAYIRYCAARKISLFQPTN